MTEESNSENTRSGDTVDSKTRKVSPFKDLIQRRVPQILGIYLATSWAIIEFLDWLINRYAISPNIPDIGLAMLASMIPTVLLLAYFHGRPGRDKWTKVEKIGIPTNVVAAVIILIFIFRGTDLSGMTDSYTVFDENGEVINKVAIKNQYRKKVFLYNIENQSGDTTLDYLQLGFPIMVEYDLAQDLFITPELSTIMYPQMVDAGFPGATGLPLTLMQRLAEKYHMDYFVTGFLNKTNDTLSLNVEIYKTKLTKIVNHFVIENTNPFIIVDELSVRIKEEIGIPDHHIRETIDLPLSEILTNSVEALYYYSKYIESQVLGNSEEKLYLLEHAINKDPDFAMAYLQSAQAKFQMTKFTEAKEAIGQAIRLLYKLPERQQFMIKYVYYVLSQEPDKVISILEMWTDLFPDDLAAHTIAAIRYYYQGMNDASINEYKEILRIDPEQYQYLNTLGNLYLLIGQNDSALYYYQIYANLFPQESRSYLKLGDYYESVCNWALAKENYNKALLLADRTDMVSIQIKLANIEIATGNFKASYDIHMKALENSQTDPDSLIVFSSLKELCLTQGKVKNAHEYFIQSLNCFERIYSHQEFLVYKIFNLSTYIASGEIEEAVNMIDGIQAQLEPPVNKVVHFGYLELYTEIGEYQKALNEIPIAIELSKGFGEEVLMSNIYYFHGKINEANNEYQKAISKYYECMELMPDNTSLYVDIARCYRLLDDYSQAEDYILKNLKHNPYNPVSNYEAALLYFDKEEEELGIKHLARAVEIWRDADMDYEKAAIAREKLKSKN